MGRGARRAEGKVIKVSPELRAAWCAMFDAGQMPIDAFREQPRRTDAATRRRGECTTSGSERGTQVRRGSDLARDTHSSDEQLALWTTAAAGEIRGDAHAAVDDDK